MRLRLAATLILAMGLGGCGEQPDREDSIGPTFTVRQPTVAQQIRDCKINGGHPDYCEVRERCEASGETDTYCRDQAEKALEEANRETPPLDTESLERERRAAEQEWERLGCGDIDPDLSEAEEARCDELATEGP